MRDRRTVVQGGFNKIYNVSIDDEPFIMRVSLPVDPRYKVMKRKRLVNFTKGLSGHFGHEHPFKSNQIVSRRLVSVSIDDEPFIMRVSLPVDPRYKVMSEVVTMDWVRQMVHHLC
jgi:hypothetical protein